MYICMYVRTYVGMQILVFTSRFCFVYMYVHVFSSVQIAAVLSACMSNTCVYQSLLFCVHVCACTWKGSSQKTQHDFQIPVLDEFESSQNHVFVISHRYIWNLKVSSQSSHLRICWSTSSHLHICWSTSSHLHICWSTSSSQKSSRYTPSHLQIYIFTPPHLQIYIFTPSHLQI